MTTGKRRSSFITLVLSIVVALVLSGCTGGGMLANMLEAQNNDDNGDSGPCYGPGAPGEAIGGTNLEKIYNFLVSSGYSPEFAAGAAGNIQTESAGGNPGLAEWGYASQFGWNVRDDRLRGWGIVQWTWGRHASVRTYVADKLGREYYVSQYSSPTAEQWLDETKTQQLLEAQLEFMLQELKGPYKDSVHDPMVAAGSPEEAAEIFLRRYEIPAGVEAQVPIRASQARAIYDQFKGNSPSSNTGSNNSGTETGSEQYYWITAKPFVLTSPYGMRVHPISGANKLHDGADIAPQPSGTNVPLYALASGKIELAASSGGWGNRVVLRLPDGHAVAYNHLDTMAVSTGDTVKGGQQIGTMGTTGYSTGVHLHFNVYKPNTALSAENTVDPMPWLTERGFNVQTGEGGGTVGPGTGECEAGGGGPGGPFPEKGDPNDPIAKNLTPETLRLLAVIRQKFPEVKDIGGWRPGSASGAPDHPNGQALDIMTYTDSALGDRIAKFLMDNAAELNVDYQILKQRIWNPPGGQNGGSDAPGAWRLMKDRGDPTQNHMDHVHVTTIDKG